jgi:putative glutathione S-transferase
VNAQLYTIALLTLLDEENCIKLFKALDRIEAILAENTFLTGDRFTEADLRLWPTIFR